MIGSKGEIEQGVKVSGNRDWMICGFQGYAQKVRFYRKKRMVRMPGMLVVV